MLANCDKCKNDFELKGTEVRKIEKDIEEIYFICPNCKEEFRVCITNKRIRDLQFEIKRNPFKQSLKSKLKVEMDKLNIKLTSNP